MRAQIHNLLRFWSSSQSLNYYQPFHGGLPWKNVKPFALFLLLESVFYPRQEKGTLPASFQSEKGVIAWPIFWPLDLSQLFFQYSVDKDLHLLREYGHRESG